MLKPTLLLVLVTLFVASKAEEQGALRGLQGQSKRSFIVVLKPNGGRPVPEQARGLVQSAPGVQVGYIYENVIQGFSFSVAEAAADAVVNALQRNPNVAYVEPDSEVSLFAQDVPTGIKRIFADTNTNIEIDGNDARVDVDVAVIDTGVDFEHPDLNVVGGVDCTVSSGGGPAWRRTYYCSSTQGTRGDDDHYHGTHVAGTIAALDNGIGVVGVAPGARIWAVKVLDSSGSGYTSGIIAGIDWITGRGDIEVANMSLGGSGYNAAYEEAIDRAVESGVGFAVAAGNSADLAANYQPARFANVTTVSALADFDGKSGGLGSPTCRTDDDDTLAGFSNYGSAVDIVAPGVCILSTYPLERGGYATISGTSMASPHAAGALALLASQGYTRSLDGVKSLYNQVTSSGNYVWTDDSGDGIQEPLLDVSNTAIFTPAFVGGGGGTGDPDTPPPTQAPTPAPTPTGGGDSSSLTLSLIGRKEKGVHIVDLSWSGATSSPVDIYRNGSRIVENADAGAYTDNTGNKGGATYTYRVCEAGTPSTCSADVTVTF